MVRVCLRPWRTAWTVSPGLSLWARTNASLATTSPLRPGSIIRPVRRYSWFSVGSARSGTETSLPTARRLASQVTTASFWFQQIGEGVAHDGGDVGADAVLLAVLSLLSAVAEWLHLVPLALGNDVADLVVGQAEDHPVRALHLLVN